MRHFLRKHLLGFEEPEPTLEGEAPPPWLWWFGLGTAVYRFFLFLGIAVTVYHYFFKALGIFLFAVEIWWFIVKPVWSELKVWVKQRDQIQKQPAMRMGLSLGVLLLLLALPWQGQVLAEGWVRSAQEFAVYSPRPARVLTMPQGGQAQVSHLLASLEQGQWLLAGMDLTLLASAALLGYAAWKLNRHQPLQRPQRQPRTVNTRQESAA